MTAAIADFQQLLDAPRQHVVDRGTLIREIALEVAALVALVTDLDDLVLQFHGTEAGRRFIEAWRRARIIVDSNGGGSIPAAAPVSADPASGIQHQATVIA